MNRQEFIDGLGYPMTPNPLINDNYAEEVQETWLKDLLLHMTTQLEKQKESYG